MSDIIELTSHQKELLGMRENESLSLDLVSELGKMVMVVAGNNGEVSPKEMEWLTDTFAKQIGLPRSIVETWANFDYQDQDLDDLLPKGYCMEKHEWLAKHLVLASIKMSMADHEYTKLEQLAARQLAEKLGVDRRTFEIIESIAKIEHTAESLRITIFRP